MADLKVSRAAMMRHVTMTVRFTDVHTWPIRFWLGTQLIRLAARCIGCGIEIIMPGEVTDARRDADRG
jgi:hypothetical protein